MEKTNARTYKRRNYFIERRFQAKFILKFCLLVFLGGLLTIGVIYFLAMQTTTVSVINSRVVPMSTAKVILPLLIQTVVIVTFALLLVTIVLTLLTSHKIAGPLYRFKKVMQSLAEGDFSSDFHIRHLDQLQDLSNTFNEMIKKLRQEQNQLKTNILSLREKLENISEQEVSEHKRPTLNELKGISQELNKIIHYFKT